MRRILALLVLVSCLSATARAEPETAAPSLKERIDPVAKVYVDSGVLMGAVIGVIDGDEDAVIGYGRFSEKRPQAPDGNTIYEIGSITKVFTGILLASLAEEGVVTLDEPVGKLLPKGVIVPSRATDDGKRQITLVDLSTHTSGLPRMPSNFSPPDPEHPYENYTAERLYQFLSAHMLRRAPSAQYEYSNLGAGLLGHALGLRAKHTYAALLRSRITNPLGMAYTHTLIPQAAVGQAAPPYTADGIPAERWRFATVTGAGAIRSNVNDMLRFARANLKPDDAPLGEALKQAQEIHWKPKGSGGVRMGLGWHAGQGNTRWHNGQTAGFHSYIAIDPDAQRAVVVLSNTATGQVDRLGREVLLTLRGQKVDPPKFRMPIQLTAEALDACTGTYELSPAFKVTVTREDNRLMAQATNQSKLRLWPESATAFFYRVVEASVTFERDDDGKVTALVLHQNDRDTRGKKVD